jgi:hypothetical protein
MANIFDINHMLCLDDGVLSDSTNRESSDDEAQLSIGTGNSYIW